MSNCFHHPEAEAVGFCRQCGKALCPDCRRDVQGVIYCETCLAATMSNPATAAASSPTPGNSNPAVATMLAFIPGVGAIYNGEYMKALMFILIFGGTISLLDSRASRGLEPFLGLFLAGFYFYMILDSYRSAKALGAGPAAAPAGAWDVPGLGGDGKAMPIGPIVLIVIGSLFLLNSMDIFRFFNVFRFWPLALIGIGVYMLWQRTGGGAPASPGTPPSEPGNEPSQTDTDNQPGDQP